MENVGFQNETYKTCVQINYQFTNSAKYEVQ